MTDEGYLAALTFNSLFLPALKKLELEDGQSVPILRSALQNADLEQPGFLLEFIKKLIQKSELEISLQEAVLRLQAHLPIDDLQLKNTDPIYVELSNRAVNLRKILSRIPDEMADRRTFLETIKEIASSIKKLLDATNNLYQSTPEPMQASVDQRKREFVKYSKKFSNTLKDYFKGEEASTVFASANQLIYQTTLIIKTVREKLNG